MNREADYCLIGLTFSELGYAALARIFGREWQMPKRKTLKSRAPEEREPSLLDWLIAVVVVALYFGILGYCLFLSLSDPPEPYIMDVP
jgi:hypothetical protein